MNILEAVDYATGYGYLDERRRKEKATIREKAGSEDCRPLDAGLYGALETYKQRAITLVVFPGVLAARATGIPHALDVIVPMLPANLTRFPRVRDVFNSEPIRLPETNRVVPNELKPAA